MNTEKYRLFGFVVDGFVITIGGIMSGDRGLSSINAVLDTEHDTRRLAVARRTSGRCVPVAGFSKSANNIIEADGETGEDFIKSSESTSFRRG